MNTETIEKHDYVRYEDHPATQKDLKILGLELELKIGSIEASLLKKLGGLIIACSSILFALLSYFHK